LLCCLGGRGEKAKQDAAQYTEKTDELKAKWGFVWKPNCPAPEEAECHEAEAQQHVAARPTSGSVRIHHSSLQERQSIVR